MSTNEADLAWASWLDHFRTNASAPTPAQPSPEQHEPLVERERQLIASSIATFQLGESSDGKHLIRFAELAASEYGVPELPEITACFVREEQLHARLLGAFMDAENIARLDHQWSDGVFRLLRRLGRFETSLSILVSAEVIGLVYYRALAKATRSRWLQDICERLIADERHHVRYEAAVLRLIRQRRSAIGRWCALAAHRTLFRGAVAVVFLGHHAVLRAGGLTPFAYVRECEHEFGSLLSSPTRHGAEASA